MIPKKLNELKKGQLYESLDEVAEFIHEFNLNVEELADYLERFSTEERVALEAVVKHTYGSKLSKKIKDVSKKIYDAKKKKFISSVQDGTYEEFLSQMDWQEKVLLQLDLGLVGKSLTGKDKLYSEIIERSIGQELTA